MYKLTEHEGFIKRISDGLVFSNRGQIGKQMWSDYQEWLKVGNEPEVAFSPADLAEIQVEEEKQTQLTSNADARAFLTDADWKCKRHKDQLELAAAGLLETTSMTEEEYIALLVECQKRRDSIK